MISAVYSSNPDASRQSTTAHSQAAGMTLSMPSFRGNAQDGQGFSGGEGLSDDFKMWLIRHPSL